MNKQELVDAAGKRSDLSKAAQDKAPQKGK
jgi:hypothetical protein